MKLIQTIFVLIIFANTSFSQTDSTKVIMTSDTNSITTVIDTSLIINSVYNSALVMSDAFIDADYDVFITYTHPKILEMTGGKEKMKEMLVKNIKPGTFLNLTLKKPLNIIVTDSTIQCTMEQRQVMTIGGKKYFVIGTLIGITYNSGLNWYFVGASGNDLAALKIHFPEFSDELNIKVQTTPELVKD